MEIGKFIIALGGALVLSFVVACLYVYHQWDGDPPIVVTRLDLESPNKDWIATLETVDNGLGFGQGMLYDEVHVRRPKETIVSHGDRAESAVFYIDAMQSSGERPHITWRDATHLVVGYDRSRSSEGRPGKSITNFHGISIEYQPTPQK
jgi:hypothetical protein